MARLEVRLDDREVQQALNQAAQALGNPRPLLKAIGELLAESTKQRFATSTAPDGSRWAPNSEVTELANLKRYKGSFRKKRTATGGRGLTQAGAKRLAGKKPLIGESRSLSTTINWQLIDGGVAVGSPMVYAGTHQFGARQGEFGRYHRKPRAGTRRRTSRRIANGYPLPWGDIPARPFLGVSEDDRADILDLVDDYLGRAVSQP